ncbi:acetate/propionate family kinase [Comamonas kerstersii]|uniref:acetate/propionate family kinase n=1 Tax=Comamonas kerstersii TaxID=225992 RepID=UPI000984BBF6|nr:acetate/propionate family kinase [Comamonas kerstersii]OOH86967.1 acetate kinase [Comamonas kerstersii]OOH90017.1 acetate kinase [Comamonas kerstersii]
MAILAVNAGSSSLKFSLHPLKDGQVQPFVLSGNIQGLEPQGSPMMSWAYLGKKHTEPLNVSAGSTSFAAALQGVRALIDRLEAAPDIEAVAHRVVHGGGVFTASVLVTDAVLEKLATFNSLAPLHQPHNLEGIRQFRAAFPQLPQIACFDTAFHATMPEVDYAFALPKALQDQGVRRYGFHGLSYQYIMSVLQERTIRGRGRVVMAHLGNGASLCAALAGNSVATTMGFSALDGLMMGTRSGALDAGVLLYLMEQGWSYAQMEKLLYKQSGLLGVSGISADMRKLRADGSENAQRAIDQFTHRVIRETGALVACLGGLDALAFSGGIGENDAVLREHVCERLSWLGIRLDAQRNQEATGKEAYAVHAPDSSVEIWVIPTDEGRVAAREAAALLQAQRSVQAAQIA